MNRSLRNELLDRGLSDMLQLDEMAFVTRRHIGGSPSDDEIMRTTLKIIRELVGSDYAIIGDVVKDDDGLLCVRSWELNTADTIKKIEDEWRKLEGPPSLGEVCWLELTDAGRKEARALLS